MRPTHFVVIILLFCMVFSETNAQWQLKYSGTGQTFGLFSAAFVDSNYGWFGGSNKTIHTTNGGYSWNSYETNFTIYDLKLLDHDNGCALGRNSSNYYIFYKTPNRGADWFPVWSGSSQGGIYKLAPVDKNLIYMIYGGNFYKSTDGGISFTDKSPWSQQNIIDLSFVNNLTGWVLRKSGNELAKTTDGGASWTKNNLNIVCESIKFINENTGYAFSGGYIYSTTDGGNSFSKISEMKFKNAAFVDKKILLGITEERKVYRTDDSSKTWKRLYFDMAPDKFSPALLCSYNKNNIWVFGERGEALKADETPYLFFTGPDVSKPFFTNSIIDFKWASSNIHNDKIRLEYSTNNGADWITIVNDIPAPVGRYSWNTSAAPVGDDVLLRCVVSPSGIISEARKVNIINESRYLKVTYPDKNSIFYGSSPVNLRWNSNYNPAQLKVEVSWFNDSTDVYPSHTQILDVDINRKEINWVGNFGYSKIRLYDAQNSHIMSESAFFKSYNTPTVELSLVDSATRLSSECEYNFKINQFSGTRLIFDYSSDDGNTWNIINQIDIPEFINSSTQYFKWRAINFDGTIKLRASNEKASTTKEFSISTKAFGVFPLEIGNKWFYKTQRFLWTHVGGPIVYEQRIDTSKTINYLVECSEKRLLADGNYYFRLSYFNGTDTAASYKGKYKYFASRYFRQEKNRVIEYANDSAKIILDFTMPGQSLAAFGKSYLSYKKEGSVFETWDHEVIADSLGFYYIHYEEAYTSGFRYLLCGCVTDGGNKTIGQVPNNYVTGNEKKETLLPPTYSLYQNYPNPFNPTTNISFDIPVTSNVLVEVYDPLGRKVSVLVNEYQSAGKHSVRFNGANLASGIYFYKITAGNFAQTRKMILLK